MSIEPDDRMWFVQADAVPVETAAHRSHARLGSHIEDALPPFRRPVPASEQSCRSQPDREDARCTDARDRLEQVRCSQRTRMRIPDDTPPIPLRPDQVKLDRLLAQYKQAVLSLRYERREIDDSICGLLLRSRDLTEAALRASDELRTALTSELAASTPTVHLNGNHCAPRL
jgi:hypothetical protein